MASTRSAARAGGRRVRGPHEEDEGRLDPCCIPEHQRPFGLFVHAKPHSVEDIRCWQAAFPDHFGERPRICPVGTFLIGRNGARRRVESNEHVWLGIGKRQAAGQGRTGLRERRCPRRVEDDQTRLEGKPVKPPCIIGNAQRFDGHILRRCNLRIHRDKRIVSIELKAVTGEIHEGHGVGPRCLCLVEEILERRAQGFAIEIARAGHIETSRLQGLGNKARVIGRWASGPAW